MKEVLLIYFILLSTLSYSQNHSMGLNPMNVDSFVAVINKRNNEFIGKPFPQFSVSEDSIHYSNETLKGKVVFINFWFAGCTPCMAEMDELNRLFEDFKENKNFEFVSFTFDDKRGIDTIKKKYNIHYNIFSISEDECRRLNNNNGFPTSVLINSTGVVRYIHSGGELNKEEIKKYFAVNVYPLIAKEL